MNTKHLPFETTSLQNMFCDWPAWETTIKVEQLSEKAHEIYENNGELLTLWGSDDRSQLRGFCLHMIFIFWEQGTLYLQCHLSDDNPSYPDLSSIFPVANRLQRMVFDLLGFKAIGSEDERPWLRHNAWPRNIFPLRNEINITDHFQNEVDEYAFVRVGGEGVHEIPVGPVHAGIIEPGHFRFHVVGEHVLRLEERLGYTHKGVAKHFQNALFAHGARLAGRISGDSTVAYAWAYSMALENLHQQKIPKRALWLRALLLERERIANHLGDLGALGNDAGFNFALNQFSRLKEDFLRVNEQLFKHRYLMDTIIPGGVCIDITKEDKNILLTEIQTLQTEVDALLQIYQEHGGLQDRFVATGIINPDLAQQLGMLGLAARASGRHVDWRTQMTYEPYQQLEMKHHTQKMGDVAARVLMRFKEIKTSLHDIAVIIQNIPKGEIYIELPKLSISGKGIGCVEGWRGPVLIVVCNKDAEHLLWGHTHDPSWQNWLALEYAVIDNIVPDFPLINKSFNLSYSGCDS